MYHVHCKLKVVTTCLIVMSYKQTDFVFVHLFVVIKTEVESLRFLPGQVDSRQWLKYSRQWSMYLIIF